jgi:hypothetical protein
LAGAGTEAGAEMPGPCEAAADPSEEPEAAGADALLLAVPDVGELGEAA